MNSQQKCVFCCMMPFLLMTLLATGVEIISPLICLIDATTIITEMKDTSLFSSLTYYFYLLFVFCAGCIFLLCCFLLQYYFTFKKKVQILRLIADLVFITLMFMVISEASKTKENEYRYYLADNWNNLTTAREFESQNNCDSLSFMNVTKTTFCDKLINQRIKIVFGTGQGLGTWSGLFITIDLIHYLVGIFIVSFSP